jgi:hypothetical protein
MRTWCVKSYTLNLHHISLLYGEISSSIEENVIPRIRQWTITTVGLALSSKLSLQATLPVLGCVFYCYGCAGHVPALGSRCHIFVDLSLAHFVIVYTRDVDLGCCCLYGVQNREIH